MGRDSRPMANYGLFLRCFARKVYLLFNTLMIPIGLDGTNIYANTLFFSN